MAAGTHYPRGEAGGVADESRSLVSEVMMIRVAVMYPKTAESNFDMDYYLTKHMPMVQERLGGAGLVGMQVDEGIGGAAAGEPAPYAAIGVLNFDSVESFSSGMAAHGAEFMRDIANFTNVQPTIQVSQVRL